MVEKFIFEFDAVGLDRVLAKVDQFRQSIRALDKEGDLGEGFQRFTQEFEVGANRATARIANLRQEIELLQTSLAKPRVSLTKELAGLAPGLEGTGKFATGSEKEQLQVQLQERILAIEHERVQLETLLANQGQRVLETKQREANLAELTNRLEFTRVTLLQQIAGLKPGGDRLQELVTARENLLLERQAELRRQLAEESARFRRAVPQEGDTLLQRELDLSLRIATARKAVATAEREVAAARQASQGAGLAEAAQFQTTASDEERAAALARQVELKERLAAAQLAEQDALLNVANLEDLRVQNAEQLFAIESSGGASVGASEILARLAQINDAYAELIVNSEQAVAGLLGDDFQSELQEVEQILQSFDGQEILSPDEEEKLASATVRARELVDQFERIPAQGIPLPLNEDEIFKGMSLLNRLLLGAARDFGRRFTATLQFALSGALLFGVQRLVREFFQAAVEVERTFADISTSLEFDIEAERGTAEFERELEGVRRQVLQIADDFNALPTEVNAAAFQMISRFTDIDAAMTATRAQILATRIATIDQSEALRALTAVAEAYSVTLVGIEDDQERQRAQAALYSKSLDLATRIQQRFGTSVEDTLEGSAGLAELFRTLGFSIEDTFALVATAVRRTGATGQNVSDKLGRAFAQFTSPEVRDQLLRTANAFDEFLLTPADFFDGGRQALFKIIEQYQSLDTGLQNKIAEIIGGRRETQFISALLQGASEGLVDEIFESFDDAAGGAESRLAVLLATVSGTIEGISTEFQTLAQNLQQLGVITPIKVLLLALEGILKVINSIAEAAVTVFEALNRVRLPFLNTGLGDGLKFLIGMVTAALALKSLIASIKLIANVRGASTLIDVFQGLLGGGTGKGAVIGAKIGGAFGLTTLLGNMRKVDGVAAKAGTAISTLFLAPLRLVQGAITAVRVRLLLWHSSILAGTATTGIATVAENALAFARGEVAFITSLLATRVTGLGAILRGLGVGILRIGGFISRLIGRVLQLAGAFVVIGGAIVGAKSIIDRIFGDPGETSEKGISDRTKELKADAEAMGQALSDADARLQAVNERLEKLGALRPGGEEGFFTELTSFAVAFLGPFRDLFGGEATFGGTPAAFERETAGLQKEKLLARLAVLGANLDLINAELGGTTDQMVDQLVPIQKEIGRIALAVSEISPDDVVNEGDLVGVARRLARQGLLIDGVRLVYTDIAGTIREWGEVLTVGEIQEALQLVQTNLQLGFTTTAVARKRNDAVLADAQRSLAQAQAGGDEEEIAEIERQIEQIRLSGLQLFEGEFDRQETLVSGISDNRTRIAALLRILRDKADDALNTSGIGGEIYRQIMDEIAGKEREYTQAVLEEAVARAQFDVDRAKTFQDRQKAYRELIKAIRAEAEFQRQIAALFAGAAGVAAVSAAEDSRLNQIIEAATDDRLRHAILVARNSTLRHKSSVDEIASIAATVNALRAEIAFMRNDGRDRQEIIAKEIELRDAVAQFRLAESDRRAAFFRLTAGTGDEIKAAQADLRAAQDRLKTILGLGGKDTQAAYEAELDVLKARERLAQLALDFADLQRRVNSDLTDTFAQALLDVQAAQEQLRAASGDLEKLEAEKALAEAESRAQREFYDRRLSDLDFLFQTDQIGRSQYIAGLRALQGGIDRTTRQGEELWREIELTIRGLMDSADQAFNIPTEIRLPTLFEVRRAVEADALGVNYQDNREQEINIFVSDDVELSRVIEGIESAFGGNIDVEAARSSSGGAAITIGSF